MLDGIDVSYWQGPNIAPLLCGLQFCASRSSIGANADIYYSQHLQQMKDYGLVTIAYHFLSYGPGDGRQGDAFLAAAKDAQILAADAESTILKYPQVISGFISYVRKHDPLKRKILLYSSESTWPGDMGQDANWVANWSCQPKMPFLFWQHRGSPLDLDYFNGTIDQLKAFAGS